METHPSLLLLSWPLKFIRRRVPFVGGSRGPKILLDLVGDQPRELALSHFSFHLEGASFHGSWQQWMFRWMLKQGLSVPGSVLRALHELIHFLLLTAAL